MSLVWGGLAHAREPDLVVTFAFSLPLILPSEPLPDLSGQYLKHRSIDQNIPMFAMSQSQYNVTSVLVLGTKPDPSTGIIMGLVSVQRMPAKSWANCVREQQRNNGDPRH